MDRSTFLRFCAAGLMLNSALYLSGCFAAGLLLGNRFAWTLALAALGAAYLSYLAHLVTEHLPLQHNLYAVTLTWLSIALGVLAGVVLLVG
jgi:hypothetical protein